MDIVPWDQWADAIATGVKNVPDELLAKAADMLCKAEVVLTAGNGGSSSLASHAAQALLKPDYKAGGGVPAVCLTDNVPTLTAHANDGGWATALQEVARPFIERLGAVLWVFSSSGKSENIINLVEVAKQLGCEVIAFTGFKGEPLKSMATLSVHVDSDDYEVIEPVHDGLIHRVQAHLRNHNERL